MGNAVENRPLLRDEEILARIGLTSPVDQGKNQLKLIDKAINDYVDNALYNLQSGRCESVTWSLSTPPFENITNLPNNPQTERFRRLAQASFINAISLKAPEEIEKEIRKLSNNTGGDPEMTEIIAVENGMFWKCTPINDTHMADLVIEVATIANTSTQEMPAIPALNTSNPRLSTVELPVVVTKSQPEQMKTKLKKDLEDIEIILSHPDCKQTLGDGTSYIIAEFPTENDNEVAIISATDLTAWLGARKNSVNPQYVRVKKPDLDLTMHEGLVAVYTPLNSKLKHFIALTRNETTTSVLILPTDETAREYSENFHKTPLKDLIKEVTLRDIRQNTSNPSAKIDISPSLICRSVLELFNQEKRNKVENTPGFNPPSFLEVYYDCLHQEYPEISADLSEYLQKLILFANKPNALKTLMGQNSMVEYQDSYGKWQVFVNLFNNGENYLPLELENISVIFIPQSSGGK